MEVRGENIFLFIIVMKATLTTDTFRALWEYFHRLLSFWGTWHQPENGIGKVVY